MTDLPPPQAQFNELDEKGKIVKVWTLPGANSFFVGRAEGNSLTLPYSWVSRKHAMIRLEDDRSYTIIDLGSSNGTFVNGIRISTPTTLHGKDLVRLGKTLLRFYRHEPEAPQLLTDDLTIDKTIAFWQQETVTILICDIHKFTRLTKIIDSHTISDILKYWSGRVSKIIRNQNGIIDKFIGDAVVAIWVGIPEPRQAISQALFAALEINYLTRGLNKEMFDILPWEISIGCALNTGVAVLGNMGINGQRDFTAIGDAVNVAFRLERMTSQSEGRDVILGETAAGHLGDLGSCFSLCQYNVKGKDNLIPAYCCSFEQLQQYLSTCDRR